jgi:hypothetical protein
MATIIYNCNTCKRGRRVEYPVPIETWYGTQWTREVDGTTHAPGETDPAARCRSCKRLMAYAELAATTSAAHKCDSRCTSARGNICLCSCGGRNHGVSWK